MEHLEGRQSVLAALRARVRRFKLILLRQGLHEQAMREILELGERMNVPVRWADRAELDAMAHGATHGGVLAVAAPKPRLDGAQLLELVDQIRTPPLLVLLEGIDDARNLGFVIRSAEALGAHAVLVKKHLWDLDPVEVARPSAGAYERLPLVQIDDIEPLRALQKRGVQLIGCLAGVSRTVWDMPLTGGVLLAIGGEKRGLSGAVRSICDQFCTIPTCGDVSLSLSHAAALVLGEAARQRRSGT
jgi:23S rRNA (guanosine2251-2'-O)-methyltransferase